MAQPIPQAIPHITDNAQTAIQKYSLGSSSMLETASTIVGCVDGAFDLARNVNKVATGEDKIKGVSGGAISAPIGMVGGMLSVASGAKAIDEARRGKIDGSEAAFGSVDILSGTATIGAHVLYFFSEISKMVEKVSSFSQMAGPIADVIFLGLGAVPALVAAVRLEQVVSFKKEWDQCKQGQNIQEGQPLSPLQKSAVLKFFEGRILTGKNPGDNAQLYERRLRRLANVAGEDFVEFLGGFFTWAKEMVATFNKEFNFEINNVNNPTQHQPLALLNTLIQSLNGKDDVEKALMIADFLSKIPGDAQNSFGPDKKIQALNQWITGLLPNQDGGLKNADKLCKLARDGAALYSNVEEKLLEKVQAGNQAKIRENIITIVSVITVTALAILVLIIAPVVGTPLWIVFTVASIIAGKIPFVVGIVARLCQSKK